VMRTSSVIDLLEFGCVAIVRSGWPEAKLIII
jgi:hypothetical protein